MVDGRDDATFYSDVLVNVLFQSFVILVDIAFIFNYVAVGSIIGWIDRDNVAPVAGMLDFLGRESGFEEAERGRDFIPV